MQLLWLVCWTPLILPVHFQLLFQQPEIFLNYLYFKPAGVRWTRDESLYCEKKQVCSEHLKAAMSWQPSVWCLHQWELAMRPNCSSMRELSVFFCLCRFHCHLCARHPKTTSWFRNITQSARLHKHTKISHPPESDILPACWQYFQCSKYTGSRLMLSLFFQHFECSRAHKSLKPEKHYQAPLDQVYTAFVTRAGLLFCEQHLCDWSKSE